MCSVNGASQLFWEILRKYKAFAKELKYGRNVRCTYSFRLLCFCFFSLQKLTHAAVRAYTVKRKDYNVVKST